MTNQLTQPTHFSRFLKGRLENLIEKIKSDVVDLEEIWNEDFLDADDDLPNCDPYIYLTIGFRSDLLDFNYQTGCNNYPGAAYGYSEWICVQITRNTDATHLIDTIETTYFHNFN